ncbi:hypothetical protein AVEN_143784-1 [Araneus ventricosus]|uniref:Uncharacterized protein n=1 Tax=Araneus ventricosus TaxID=182803 RepID=A0A4Y2AQR1_ARAVE|nr:hypothetical protein AVEN_143784-1 [Araneus ventricosus]
MENEGLFPNMQEKHIVQVIGTITLVQISNTNRQQFTSNNSNRTFGFRNSQQISNNDSNSTFNSAQLTGFPTRTANETPKSFLERRLHSVYISMLDWLLRHMEISSNSISPLVMEISRKSPSRQNGHRGQGLRHGRCPSLHAYPYKIPFPTIRLARQQSDITSL